MTVSSDLTSNPLDTVEIHVPMSDSMKLAHSAILELIAMCISELRRYLPADIELGTSLAPEDIEEKLEWTSGSHVLKKRYKRRAERDGVGSIVESFLCHGNASLGVIEYLPPGSSARKLISDLNLLRNMIGYLLDYDAITFLTFLEAVFAASAPKSSFSTRESLWLLTDAAATLMTVSRSRVYLTPGSESKLPKPPIAPQLIPVNEVLPKWQVAKDTLDEISNMPPLEGDEIPSEQWKVLILCKEASTSLGVLNFILQGQSVSSNALRRYIQLKNRFEGIKDGDVTKDDVTTGSSKNFVRDPKRRRVRTTRTVSKIPEEIELQQSAEIALSSIKDAAVLEVPMYVIFLGAFVLWNNYSLIISSCSSRFHS
jgi:DNA excision repair protein ERCC-4